MMAGDPAERAVNGGSGDGLTFSGLLRRLGPVAPLTLASMILPPFGGFLLLYKVSDFGPWLRSHGMAGIVLYVSGFAIASGLALLPTYAQSLLAGWAFGLGRGSAAVMCGVLGGSLLGYLIARRGAGTRVTGLIEQRPKWKAVYDALLNSGAAHRLLIVTLLRLPPNSPFALTNVVMAATRVPLASYLVGTLLGVAPRSIAVVYVGATLERFDAQQAEQKWMTIAGIVLLVIVVAVIGRTANKAITRVTATPAASGEGTPPQRESS